jgi:hypothetical protein
MTGLFSKRNCIPWNAAQRSLTNLSCGHAVEHILENDAEYEQANDKLPFISRIEIKAMNQEVKLIVKGFDPEREPLEG